MALGERSLDSHLVQPTDWFQILQFVRCDWLDFGH
jgi:hypothetical protein